MRSFRYNSFVCIAINCVAVSTMVVLMALTLHNPQPVIIVDVQNILPSSLKSTPAKPSLFYSPDLSANNHTQTKHDKPLKDKQTTPVTSTNTQLYSVIEHTQVSDKDDPIREHIQKQSSLFNSGRQSRSLVAKQPEVKRSTDHSPLHGESRRALLSDDKKQTQVKGHQENQPIKTKANNYFKAIPSKHQEVSNHSNNNVVVVAQVMNSTEKTLRAMKLSKMITEDTHDQFSTKLDVLPLVAFFDSRPRYGHKNSTVILVQVRDVKRIRYNRIVGCGIDNITAKAFRVKPLYLYRNWIRSNFPNLTHTEAVLTCYDVPSKNGSKPFVLYRPYRIPGLLKVYSERPALVHTSTKPPSLSVVVCTTVYDQPPWLSEWLRYQQTIGVDFIHIYAQQSFVDQGGMDNPELKQLLADNKLTVDVRSTHLNSSQIYYYSQPLYYQDCVLRYRGVYEFAMLIDTDDFFVPRIANETDIHDYVNRLFTYRIGSVKLDWIRYFPSCGLTTPPELIKDGNVTDHLTTYKCHKEYIKSIHRLSHIHEVAVHEVTYMLPGFKKQVASNSTAYIAHIRKTDGCHVNSSDNASLINAHYEIPEQSDPE